uniref:Leucine-rich repeat-containing G-protein coupled receptor 5-like isoform X4 n=1 Tax=Hirondellea gigas TaxID=1518452 RepID=A0A6A7G5K8_9CRUS
MYSPPKTMPLHCSSFWRIFLFFVQIPFLKAFIYSSLSNVLVLVTIVPSSRAEISSENYADLNASKATSDGNNTSFSSYCPSPCSCTPRLPPPILPGLWGIAAPIPLPLSSPDQIKLLASCEKLGLRAPPPLPSPPADAPQDYIVVEMDLSGNKLQKLPGRAFHTYEHLRELQLSHNSIQHIRPQAFYGLRLQTLILDDNELEWLPETLLWLGQLEELSLEQNYFTVVPAAVSSILSLKTLNLAHNKLTRLQEEAFSNLPNLVSLSLNHNSISSVHVLALAALPSLQRLNLVENLLSNIPSAVRLCPSITQLLLSNNKISSVMEDSLTGLIMLEEVTLNGNPLHFVHHRAFAALPSLNSLVLQEVSGLQVLPSLAGTSSLDSLRIDRGALRRVPPNICAQAPLLRSLNLHHNLLETTPDLHLCRDLRLLDLSHNRLHALGSSALLQQGLLQDLLLQHNFITKLEDGAFMGLHGLQILNLEHNMLYFIGAKAFLPLVSLKDINLGNNDLQDFPSVGLEHVTTLKVHHNSGLKVFPGPERFWAAHTLVLSYAYHCCPYLSIDSDDKSDGGEGKQRFTEDVIYNVEDIQAFDNALLLNMTDVWSDLEGMNSDFGALWAKLAADFPPSVATEQASSEQQHGPGPSNARTPPRERLGRPSHHRQAIVHCIPKPSPFMPCRDLFDWWTLRCGVWIVFLLALLGNGTVVIVLFFARSKLDVPRFLVANLALADFFMGIYLGVPKPLVPQDLWENPVGVSGLVAEWRVRLDVALAGN